MREDQLRKDDMKPTETPSARLPWVRPTVTKMDAADAEVGTRAAVNDGSFSVS